MFNWSKKKGSADPVSKGAVSYAAAYSDYAGGEISAEIIAVIAAAIAAMTSGGTAGESSLIIRKISRIHGEKLSWSNAGLMECIDSRRI